jgi:hypothetical protein
MVLPSFLSSVLAFLQERLSVLFVSHGCGKVYLNLELTARQPPQIDRGRKRDYLDFGI